jgi:hypothetical protein
LLVSIAVLFIGVLTSVLLGLFPLHLDKTA